MKTIQYQECTEVQKQCTNNYQSIFSNATVPIIIWDEADHIILEVNQAASSYFGYSSDELAAMQINQLETLEEAQHIPARIKTLLEQGHIVFETVLRNKVRIIIHAVVSISRIMWDDRTAFCSIYHPITEQKQDKVLLGESEARFRAITDSTNDAIIIMDGNGLISLWNPAAEEIFGYAGSEVIGRNLHALLTPSRYHQEQAAKAFHQFQQAGEGNAINNTIELKACHRDGHEISIELSLSSIYMLGAFHTIGIIRDITARKNAEEELRESEERFRALHNASFGGIIIHDQGVIIDCNQRFSEISGYARDELIGMDGLQLIAPDWRSRVTNKIHLDYGVSYDALGIRKDGTTYPLCIRGSNIPYKGYQVHVTEFRDISERKQAEEERKKLEDQLIQAQKMEAIGTLAGGIAHDFNNILSAILGNVDLARNLTPATSPAANLLDKALAAIHRATLLIRQILGFSRQQDIELVRLQVSPVINETIKLLRSLLPSTIKIAQQIQENSRPILADPTQVHQILMNICTNAFHAMELTGGTLTITLKNVDFTSNDLQQPNVKPGPFVVLGIGDTGPGIPSEVQNKIFDPYFTTKCVGKGTGMGLAIVNCIIKKYGGFITVDSEQGKGTWFHIHLPAVEQAELLEDVEDLLITRGDDRILLVDDEDIVADMGRSILEHLGYKVTVFTNSVEALSAFQQSPSMFDVVITDQTMPAMTGSVLAQRMLAIRPDIPIIICTGYSSTVSVEQAKAIGVRGFAMKPFAIKDISILIRKVIDE